MYSILCIYHWLHIKNGNEIHISMIYMKQLTEYDGTITQDIIAENMTTTGKVDSCNFFVNDVDFEMNNTSMNNNTINLQEMFFNKCVSMIIFNVCVTRS